MGHLQLPATRAPVHTFPTLACPTRTPRFHVYHTPHAYGLLVGPQPLRCYRTCTLPHTGRCAVGPLHPVTLPTVWFPTFTHTARHSATPDDTCPRRAAFTHTRWDIYLCLRLPWITLYLCVPVADSDYVCVHFPTTDELPSRLRLLDRDDLPLPTHIPPLYTLAFAIPTLRLPTLTPTFAPERYLAPLVPGYSVTQRRRFTPGHFSHPDLIFILPVVVWLVRAVQVWTFDLRYPVTFRTL